MPLQTHLSAIQVTATNHPSWTALKVAQNGPTGLSWMNISYSSFERDTQACARFWANQLSKAAVKERSVVGLWLKGTSYTDITHILGISRAGFIPQLISLRMTDPSVVYELLSRAEAVALIHDSSFTPILKNSLLPTYSAENIRHVSGLEHLPLPPPGPPLDPEDVLMIYHTSGSTSGIPKLVPITTKWMDCLIRKAQYIGDMLPSSGKQLVMVAIGSFSHLGGTLMFMESICRGGCYILPTQIPYPAPELRQMIDGCGLTRLNIFPPSLSSILYEARHDPSFLTSLKTLDYISYGGLALDPTDEAWARGQGLRLVNFFGSTEVGIMMISGVPLGVPYLQPLPESKYEFVPLQATSDFGEQLLEVVVSPESSDCPATSLLSPQDGKFYTGDLFIEVGPGQYISKGRNDDWIKMEMALRCDASSIEVDAMQRCGDDLINVVVVVGVGRPSPAMVVELRDGDATNCGDTELIWRIKVEILRRISPFHRRRYVHERIEDARLILVTPAGTLPRTATKGNVRRKEVEEMFKTELDKVYLECASG